MPLLETKGAGSAQGFGLSLGSAEAVYVEDVFSTYLYTGNGSTQTITNGIDLGGEGGLVWTKPRTTTSFNDHILVDSARGDFQIQSNTTAANNAIASFNFASTGYTAPSNIRVNAGSVDYVSWTFRKQPKFFDVVTYTGDGVAGRTVAHDLGSVPGCIMVKRTDAVGSWHVFHTSLGATKTLFLNATNAALTDIRYWDNTAPTAAVFTLGYDTDVNASGGTYVAYLFAHNAGGFGLTGTDNVISCGSFTVSGTPGALTNVNLGYEPQWLLVKASTTTFGWEMADVMRGLPVSGSLAYLAANTSNAETTSGTIPLTPTGFNYESGNTVQTYIYIAIRRGPMKVPTSGTQVFSPALGNGASGSFDTSFPVDFGAYQFKPGGDPGAYTSTRLLANGYMQTGSTNAEAQFGSTQPWDRMEDWYATADNRFIGWGFRRAPGFFDVVCYTGTGSARTVAHNLAAVPELMIVKRRNDIGNWIVYHAILGNTFYQNLNYDFATSGPSSEVWSSTTPSSSSFSVANFNFTNASGSTFVAYLFATVAGVSKVGSYTGTGTTQVINCGFTAGSRFVMIKRTDSTGDWYVWDSARGIVAGNDPYLLLNSTAAEVTNTDYVDTAATGFEISSTAPAAINANGGTFIFLAIA